MLVVLFILMLSMAPAQPALAHPSLAADYDFYYPDYYEPDNSRDSAKDLTRSFAPWPTPAHTIHNWYDVDWGYFDVSTAGSYVMVTLDYFRCSEDRCAAYEARPANFTIYMPNGMTGDGRRIYPDLVGGVPTTPVDYVFTICNARPGRYYVQSFGEYGPVYGYNIAVQITPPWNGNPYSIPYSLPTSGCDYDYPSLIHR
jgi:hypothetical protein